jgi:hypothetical protein
LVCFCPGCNAVAVSGILFSFNTQKYSMKKFQEIILSGASSFIYDILQKTIDIVRGRNASIIEIGQSEVIDKNGNSIILINMILDANNTVYY